MEDDIIKIVYLPPLRVASFHAMGKGIGDPETKAWKELKSWAKKKRFI